MAYFDFIRNVHRIRRLLEVGLIGVADKVRQTEEIIQKVKEAKVVPKSMTHDSSHSRPDKPHQIIIFGVDSARTIREAMESSRLESSALRFHLYAILTVAIWAAFETYIVKLFGELYRKRPEMLSSDETLSYKDAINHKDAIVDYLIERQVEKMGHFTLTETLKHLRTRINFEFAVVQQRRLAELNVVRNIVAHNLGTVQESVRDRLPNSIVLRNNQIRVTKAFADGMLKIVYWSVVEIEKHCIKAFFRSKVSAAKRG